MKEAYVFQTLQKLVIQKMEDSGIDLSNRSKEVGESKVKMKLEENGNVEIILILTLEVILKLFIKFGSGHSLLLKMKLAKDL